MPTIAEENYIKAIFSLQVNKSKAVSTNLIAKELKTKASSVTDMLQKLSEKKMVNYIKYKGVSLTKEGERVALKIVRRHRLWEVFLVDKLNYNWDEVHDLAEQLEHIKSKNLVDRLDEFLNFPAYDPHGDPIPDKYGNINHHKNIMLSSIVPKSSCKVVGIKDSSPSFLKFLDASSITLGSYVEVLKIEEFDNSMLIKVSNKTFSISNVIAKNLYVTKL